MPRYRSTLQITSRYLCFIDAPTREAAQAYLDNRIDDRCFFSTSDGTSERLTLAKVASKGDADVTVNSEGEEE